MFTQLRKTGITVGGDLPWGTHFCLFYETKQDLLDCLVPYFRAGLENNEYCLWVLPEIQTPDALTREEAQSALRQAVPDLDRYLAERRIELLRHDEWFLEEGVFDLHRVINRLQGKLDQALARGLAGLRLNGSTAWMQKKEGRDFFQFEQELDALIAQQPLLVLCNFPLATSAATEILDAARTHQFAAAHRQGEWELLEAIELRHARAEIQRLNAELEQRVVERTSELAAANEELRREVAERRQVEAELRRQKEILQTIFDHIPVMIRFMDAAGRYELVNREWERIFGWSLEEIVSQNRDTFAEFYPDSQEHQRVLNFVAESTGEWADFQPHLRDGRVIDTSWASIRLSDGTHIGIGLDVTERKRAEEAEHEQMALAEALRDTTAALSSTLDFEEVLQRILANVGRVVPHDTSAIMLVDDDYLRVVGHTGFVERGLSEWVEGFRIAIDQHPGFRRIIQNGEPVLLSDIQAQMDWETAPELYWVHSYLSVPIRSKGKALGVLNLHRNIPNFFSPAHATRLQVFADQAGIALENARLLQGVEIGRERLQTLSRQLLAAQEMERRAIARELHDEIGQVLTAVSVNLRVIELSPDPATCAERVAESLTLVDNVLGQIRDLALDLRPSLLDDFGLVPALEWYLERQAHRSGFQAELVAAPADMRLPPHMETTCFRLAQIALTNVARHAQATQVRVELRHQGNELELVVHDNGIGFDVPAAMERAARGATLGLLSMLERAQLAGGELTIRSTPGRGTAVRARFPLD